MWAHLTLMDSDGAFSDGEAEADAAAVLRLRSASARKKGLKRLGEAVFRDAGAIVANGDDSVFAWRRRVTSMDEPFGRVADSVAEDVFDGAAKEFAVAKKVEGVERREVEMNLRASDSTVLTPRTSLRRPRIEMDRCCGFGDRFRRG